MTEPQRYEIHKAADGRFYWIVKAENGATLATSETYERTEGAVKGAVAAGAEEGKIVHVSTDPAHRLDVA